MAGYEMVMKTAPVGSFSTGASPYGALDMVGNVWEWTADWYDEEQKIPLGPWGFVGQSTAVRPRVRPRQARARQPQRLSRFSLRPVAPLCRGTSLAAMPPLYGWADQYRELHRASWPGSALSMRARRAKKTAALRPVVAHAKPVGVFICWRNFSYSIPSRIFMLGRQRLNTIENSSWTKTASRGKQWLRRGS